MADVDREKKVRGNWVKRREKFEEAKYREIKRHGL